MTKSAYRGGTAVKVLQLASTEFGKRTGVTFGQQAGSNSVRPVGFGIANVNQWATSLLATTFCPGMSYLDSVDHLDSTYYVVCCMSFIPVPQEDIKRHVHGITNGILYQWRVEGWMFHINSCTW